MFDSVAKAAVEKAFVERAFAFAVKPFVKSYDFVLKAIDYALFRLALMIIRCRSKIQGNKIVFTNFSGNYDCNPKYICEEILRRGLHYDIVWVIWGGRGPGRYNDPQQFPEGIRTVKRYSYEFYKELLTAKVIVDNGTSYASAKVRKKEGQIVINTFHGSLGIKMAPKEDGGKNTKHNDKARFGGAMTDFAISNSEFEDGYYRDTYFGSSKILRLGHPRNDLLFRKDAETCARIRKRVYSFFNLDPATKICLYAPTFRADHDIRPYAMPYAELMTALKARFGGEWVVLTRFHHQAKRFTARITFPAGVISATEYPDIAELMFCADVGITDYSNWICEYIHTGRPSFLYATDMVHYRENERLFYDPLDQMPFPLATDIDQLTANIRSFDLARYAASSAEFITKKGCMEDGKASARVVDLIKEHMSDGV